MLQMTDTQTNGWTTTYSERERDFTFADKTCLAHFLIKTDFTVHNFEIIWKQPKTNGTFAY